MREQLEALSELAKIDLGFRQLDVERDEINGRVTELRNDVARMRDLLDREKARMTEAEQLKVQTAGEISDLGDRLTRSTQRYNNAKTNREKEAMQRELEVLRREREERTAKIAELDAVVKQVRESLASHDLDFAKLQEVLTVEEAGVGALIAAIDVRRAALEETRKGVLSRLRPDILRKYHTIRDRKGTAVAEVVGGICRGCNITLPPQMFAKLHAGTLLHQCPNCQRILLLRPTAQGV